MTLGSETAAVLMRAMVTLNHQTSAGQHALLTPDERRSAMHQLTVAFETAAKLADVAHLEAAAVVAQYSAADAGAEHMRAGTAQDDGEVKTMVAETERTKGGVGVVGGVTKQQTAKGSPAVVEATTNPLETHGIVSNSTLPIRNTPRTTSPQPVSSPVAVPRPISVARIIGLCADSDKVSEIAEGLDEWNSNNVEQYTLAGWAWFKYSETEAFIFLSRPGLEETYGMEKISERTGRIELLRTLFRDLDMSRGYHGYIYGSVNAKGKRDRVKFE